MIITDAQDGLDEGNYVLGIRERPEDGSRGLIFIEGMPDGDEEMEGEMNSYCLVADSSLPALRAPLPRSRARICRDPLRQPVSSGYSW